MASESRDRDQRVWAPIERERRIDKRLRRVSVVAWAFTFFVTLAFAAFTGLRLSLWVAMSPRDAQAVQMAVGMASAVLPLLLVLGILSTLIATLATVGIFLRLRTASLHEIQLRLAGLEEMMTRDDSSHDAPRR